VARRVLLLLLASLAVSGCGDAALHSAEKTSYPARSACPRGWTTGWHALADRIGAPVYCPSWITPPLTGEIHGTWNNIYSVDRRDKSYLVGFTWYEVGSGEVHVNFRGYPGSTKIPRCPGDEAGKTVPCFADASGHKRIAGRRVTVYTANQGADKWHIVYAWKRRGSLYVVSEHVAVPLTYRQVARNLDRMVGSLRLLEPSSG
jgi:hypothetical protein